MASRSPLPTVFLHGTLEVTVVEARQVEGSKSARFLKKLERAVTSSLDGVDPYCTVKLGYNKVMQTAVIQNNSSPSWKETATFDVCTELDALEFRIKAAKRTGALSVVSKVQHLSMLAMPAEDIVEKRVIDGWFPLTTYIAEKLEEENADGSDTDSSDEDGSKMPSKPPALGDLHVKVVYTPVGTDDVLQKVAVPNAYFPARKGIDAKLYQDADCPPGSLPTVPFHPEYVPNRCYRDIARAIATSTKLIYITGWAVWPELNLIRTDYEDDSTIIPKGMTLADLLIKKANEGVTVCVMVWDELASNAVMQGMMGTHDEEVVQKFSGTKVNAIKVPRVNPKNGPFADLNDALLFTHHQKTVITTVDDPHGSGKARMQAFVGGLDLTDGRYDNGTHSLFRTIKGVHAAPDFWQACALDVGKDSGPREPWHDIHSFVTGTSAWDVLANFEGRWKRQAADKMKPRLHKRPAEEFVVPSEESAIRDGSFNCQLLRSISEASSTLDATRPGLVKRRKAHVDQSIHHAYVHQIRRSVSFVYLENQYFLGSTHMWKGSNQRGGFASHLVHIELAQKICAKIRAGQRYAVYVCVPMYPEGPPDSAAVQEILSHQRKSVMVITRMIAEAIEETGSDTEITDWFNIFCLVNREGAEGGQGDGGTNETEQKLSKSRRFMIYNHSKYGSFDDTVAIIGSANINGRSLDGSRDTEICNMLWQTEHRATGSTCYNGDVDSPAVLPKGDIAAFRCNVWSEHLGGYYPEFEDPSSLACVHKIRELAKANWDHFANDDIEPSDMPHGHLALYPYEFEKNGRVETNGKHFPDFPTAPIKGKSGALPNMLTG